MLEKILIGLLTGLIGLLLGNRLRLGSESSSKRKRFRSFLEILHAKIESTPAGEFFHSQDLKQIQKLDSECLEVRQHIHRRKIKSFDAAIKSYKAVSFDGWAGPDIERQQLRNSTNEKSKSLLISSIIQLDTCAKSIF